jgi:DNA-binding IclR family transcriptional regulator
MSDWTFITKHTAVLRYVVRHPMATARELSHTMGITERTVINIINDLCTAGYLSKTRQGRRILYSVHLNLPLRHEALSDVKIGRLLETLGDEGKGELAEATTAR